MMLKTFFITGLMLTNPLASNSEVIAPSPDIVKFYTSVPVKDNWIEVPEGMKELTIEVEALNTETVLFWLIPTGSAQWNERELIGYDIKDDRDNYFSITWNIPRQLQDHLHVQALGENEISSFILNITTEP